MPSFGLELSSSAIVLAGAVFRAEQLLVTGELVYVFADAATRRPKPVPGPFRDLLAAYEAGQPMVQVRVGSWADLSRDAQPKILARSGRLRSTSM